jgi:integrase
MSKTQADEIAGELRKQIRANTLRPDGTPITTADPTAPLTFADVVKTYTEKVVEVPTRRLRAQKHMLGMLAWLRDVAVPGAHGTTVRLGDKPFRDVTRADVEAVRLAKLDVRAAGERAAARLQAAGDTLAPGERKRLKTLASTGHRARCGGLVAANRTLAQLRAVCAWAVAEGHADATPFRRFGVPCVKLAVSKEVGRQRRLTGDEEARLLKACGPHLYAVVTTLLWTGMRVGEALALQWQHVRLDASGKARHFVLPASNTKTNRARVVPIGDRVRAILDMRKTSPLDGKDFGPDAFVFGDETGAQIAGVATAWRLACRRAKIDDLRVHDLRHEAGSRALEAGVSLHLVRDLLGHSSVVTTSRYLASTSALLETAVKRMEDAAGTLPATPTETAPEAAPEASPDAICTKFAQTPAESGEASAGPSLQALVN